MSRNININFVRPNHLGGGEFNLIIKFFFSEMYINKMLILKSPMKVGANL